MRALLIFMVAALLVGCTTSHPVRIIKTGERARVEDRQDAYAPGDTVVLVYSYTFNEWRIDKNWFPFKGDSYASSSGVIFMKATIE